MKTDPNFPKCAGCIRSSHNAHCAWAITGKCVDGSEFMVKNGMQEMSYEEKRKYVELAVAIELANHYEFVAQSYLEKAMRLKTEFWNLVRMGHKVTTPTRMVVSEDMQSVKLEKAEIVRTELLPRVPREEDGSVRDKARVKK